MFGTCSDSSSGITPLLYVFGGVLLVLCVVVAALLLWRQKRAHALKLDLSSEDVEMMVRVSLVLCSRE